MDESEFATLSSCTVAIVGLGLMGGSLALALDGRCRAVLGVDSDPKTRARARALGIFARVTAGLERPLPDADLLVLATPVRTLLAQTEQIAGQAAGRRKPHCLLDLGSTKAQVVAAMARLPEGWQAVGGHPLCGKEVAGLAAAERGLFAGHQFCLSPVPGRTSARARRLAEELVRAVGARPLWLEAEVHDRLVAVTSHLPYLLAVALAACGGAAQTHSPVVAQLAASGFRDTSRLAASDVTMMADALATNRPAVTQALDRCAEVLAELRALLASGADDDLAARLAEARAARRLLVPA